MDSSTLNDLGYEEKDSRSGPFSMKYPNEIAKVKYFKTDLKSLEINANLEKRISI